MAIEERPAGDAAVRPLTLALAHYDRHVALLEGSVDVVGFPCEVLEVGQSEMGRHGTRRHSRMLKDREFEIAEVSLSSYLMARDRGAPFTAIPVFPRRLFSLSQMWVHKGSGISSPGDLRGRKVGLNTFQTTLSVLAKADLGRMYGVSWRDITWVTQREETIAVEKDPGVTLEHLAEGETLVEAMIEGRIDAIMVPHPTEAMLRQPEIGRLLQDPQGEEVRYFHEFGYFPIMHVLALRAEVPETRPTLPEALFDAFERSKKLAERRWDDPNWSMLAWGRQALEGQRELFGAEIWPNGIESNRANLEWFIEQSCDQGLIGRPLKLDDLFHPSMLMT